MCTVGRELSSGTWTTDIWFSEPNFAFVFACISTTYKMYYNVFFY